MHPRHRLAGGFLMALLAAAGLPAATPPGLINYQAILRDAAGKPLTGSYDILFSFYDESTGSANQILQDLHTVTVSGGLLNVQLGGGMIADGTGRGTYTSLTDVFHDFSEVWMQIDLGASGGSLEALAPRVRVVASAYALNASHATDAGTASFAATADAAVWAQSSAHADDAAMLGGRTPDRFLDDSFSPQIKAGSLALGSAGSPSHRLVVQSPDLKTLRLIGPGSFGSQARLNFGDADFVYLDEDLDDNLTIHGGTRTAITGGNVGIGTTSPQYKLDVDGFIQSRAGGVVFPDGTIQPASAIPEVPRTPLQIATLSWYAASGTGTKVSVGITPEGIAFDGQHLWVANCGGGSVTKIRAYDKTVAGTFFVSSCPDEVAFNGTDRIYVSDFFAGEVKVLNLNGGVVGTVSGLTQPGPMASDGTCMWVGTTGALQRLFGATVVSTLPIAYAPQGLAYDGTYLWATSAGSVVHKIRAADGLDFGSFPVGSSPEGVVFDGTNIWVANYLDDTVTKLRAGDGSVKGTYTVGDCPAALVFDGYHIWVGNRCSGNVTKLRARDGVSMGTFSSGTSVWSLAFDGMRVWATNRDTFGAVSLF